MKSVYDFFAAYDSFYFHCCRMLAYRVEDIYVRLEPQELYSREEHENNIQIDVCVNLLPMYHVLFNGYR